MWIAAIFAVGVLFVILGYITGPKGVIQHSDDGGALQLIGLVLIGIAIGKAVF